MEHDRFIDLVAYTVSRSPGVAYDVTCVSMHSARTQARSHSGPT